MEKLIKSGIVLMILGSMTWADSSKNEKVTVVTVHPEKVRPLDPKIFGSFMERAGFSGEIGVEAGVDPQSGMLHPLVEKKLAALEIPILRFPGGANVDYLDWRDLIDNVPGRKGGRPVLEGEDGPVTNHYGYDEFLQTCEKHKIEPLLVVNFGDGMLEKTSWEKASAHAASLVAYVNGSKTDSLSEVNKKWVEIRTVNGHAKPYGVKYWEIGNEMYVMMDKFREKGWNDSIIASRYLEGIEHYVRAMKAVDSSIQILVDLSLQEKKIPIANALHKKLGKEIDYFVQHFYSPWNIKTIWKGGEKPAPESLTDAEVWHGWTSMPEIDSSGQANLNSEIFEKARDLGYKMAITEWNWNGWWDNPVSPEKPLNSNWARGVGAAGYLHAFIRNSDVIEIANQSLTIGNQWPLTSIRVDTTWKSPPYYQPTGMVVALYGKHHGNHVLKSEIENPPYFSQPYRIGRIRQDDTVSYLDIVVSGSEGKILLHVINRSFDSNLPLKVDLSSFDARPVSVKRFGLEGNLKNGPGTAWEVEDQIKVKGKLFPVSVPRRSVNVYEVHLSK